MPDKPQTLNLILDAPGWVKAIRASDEAVAVKHLTDLVQSVVQTVEAAHAKSMKSVMERLFDNAYSAGRKSRGTDITLGADAATLLAGLAARPTPEVHVAGTVVNVPAQAAPTIHVAASPPVVNVTLPDPKPRRQIAVEQSDGSVILEDLPDGH
jgi:hypothetical protein